ncbi:MAG: hypothetical protein AB1813_12250 [Verrucomicrobiota bacterium]
MKIDCPSRTRRIQNVAGYLLVEMMIYIILFAVVMGMAMAAFSKCLDISRDLDRNASDIIQATRAGERWRADIRSAAQPPKEVELDGRNFFEIETTEGLIVYHFGAGIVWRKEGEQSWRPLLSRVKSSRMIADRRQFVQGWSWEIEMQSRKRIVRVPPLFSFLAVTRDSKLTE